LRDIVILMRAMKNRAPRVVEVLRARGVSAWSDLGEGFYEQLEVEQMLDLLHVLDNPLQDTPLLGALRGPACGLSEEALARIRIGSPEGTFEAAARVAAQGKDAIAEALRTFALRVDAWRFEAKIRPLHALLYNIYEETGFLAEVGVRAGGRARQANLRMLAEEARRFQREQRGALHGFLRHVDRVRAHDSQAAQEIGDGEEIVRIMSVHKAKGLQWPAVFVMGLGQAFNRRDSQEAFQAHGELGLGDFVYDTELTTRRQTMARKAISARRTAEALAEEARVLYVAMTRAEKYLFLYGGVKGLAEALARWERPLTRPDAAGSPLDWVVPVALGCRDASEWVTVTHAWDGGQARSVSTTEGEEVLAAEDLFTVVDFAFTMPAFSQRPLKQSVTERLRGEDLAPEPLARRPLFLQERVPLTGAERGEALHLVLSQMDFETVRRFGAQRALTDVVGRFLERGMFSTAQAEAVPLSAIAALMEGPLGMRILASPRVEREWAFNQRMGELGQDILLQGVIDCCFLEDDCWVLVDYKTDRAEDLLGTIAQYAPQALLYGQALGAITGRTVKERILYLFARGQGYLV
jgi:ATP-dependent helicase/nuclease subunit A